MCDRGRGRGLIVRGLILLNPHTLNIPSYYRFHGSQAQGIPQKKCLCQKVYKRALGIYIKMRLQLQVNFKRKNAIVASPHFQHTHISIMKYMCKEIGVIDLYVYAMSTASIVGKLFHVDKLQTY